ELEKRTEVEPEKRAAQKALAEEMTRLVHGEEALKQAINISEALFSGDIKSLSVEEIQQGFKDVPSFEATQDSHNIVELLVQAKISSSKRQAREDVQNGAICINGERFTDLEYIIDE